METFKILLAFVLIQTMLVPDAEAARKRRRSRYPNVDICGANKATTTVYNLPQEDRKETWPGFKTFKDSVKMQGSGRRANGNIARYKGPDVTVPKTCKTTTTSSSGNCLLSYFSIAADPRSGWRMGDIIYMRSLADQEITLPSGRRVRHPGFLIVHDIGGAIKGPNRFDFFVGQSNPYNSEFQKFNFADKNKCDNKEYVKIDTDSDKYRDALAQIYKNQDDDTNPKSVPGLGPTQTIAGVK